MLSYILLIETEEDKSKFERIYNNYRQTMYYAAYHILKNEHTAEDIVHQAFLRVIDHLDKIDENNCHKTKAFLVVITEHLAIDYYRKQKRANIVSYEEMELYVADEQIEQDDDVNEIISAIELLPINYSSVLRLKYSQGYQDSEIARILNITEDNVRKRISRAKKKLALLLNRK